MMLGSGTDGLIRESSISTGGRRAADCLHEFFEARAEHRPDAVAVVCDGHELSYGELNARANRLASFLLAKGVCPETLIALWFDRCNEMLIAILGVLKAGCAYVPLDPVYPQERLKFMLDDSECPMVLTQDAMRARLPEGTDAEVVCIDGDWDVIASHSSANPCLALTHESLAYVIYTSGSTGKPKGTLISHGNVVRLFTSTESWFQFADNDVWTLFHSYAFDFSVWEIWGALMFGGRLVVVPYLISRSPAAFYDLLRREGVTMLSQTPSAFSQLMRHEEALDAAKASLPALRTVVFGGEALDPASLCAWFERHGDARPRLVNMYGITETTVHVTYRPLTVEDAAGGVGSRIGVAIPDLQLYVCDENMRLVPDGEPGELYVGGAGLARGYLNRPELTGKRFVPNPFNGRGDSRLYRTGDLVRSTGDGRDMEYLGRIDFQVKIRGFRVELGEIESVLAAHPAVRDAVVLAREDTPGDKRLAAYLVLRREVTRAELREHMRRRLPDYMLPGAFVFVESLPLTPNGKTDRRALPAPDWSRRQVEHDYVAPRTVLESALAEIWQGLLGVESVGVDDGFFELGGHSLLAAQMISRVRDALDVELPLRGVFEASTVASLARFIEENPAVRHGVSKIGLASRDSDLRLSFSQEQLWVLEQLYSDLRAYNIAFAYRLKGHLDLDALRMSLDEIVRRHETLRTVFTESDGVPAQVVAPPSPVELPVIDVSSLDADIRESEADRMMREESGRHMDLSIGPLFRVSLYRLADEDHALFVMIHHIVSDGWSFSIMIHEIGLLYEAFAQGKSCPLAQPVVQFADFAAWQRDACHGEVLDHNLAYWKRRLAGELPLLSLPLDYPRPPVQTFEGDECSLSLPEGLSDGLRELSLREGATLFVTLLSGWAALLSRYTGQHDVIIGSGFAGRNRAEVEGLIGFFINTVALRMDLSGTPAFREIMARAREVALGAQEHQELPFGRLVEEIQADRDMSRPPVFQVMFVLHNTPAPTTSFGGLAVEAEELHNGTSKFDLTLAAVDHGGGIDLYLEYNTALFSGATASRMLDGLRVLLEGAVENPGARLSDLPILTDAEGQWLVEQCNATDADYPRDASIVELFEQWAARNPDAPAVMFGEVVLSYGKLNSNANRLARHLLESGATPGDPVAICMERSVELVTCILAALKAGCAYVPLDPDYPGDRICFMIDDVGAALVLTRGDCAGASPDTGARVVDIDEEWSRISKLDDSNLPGSATGDSTAYVLYTSGSTGKPKGVAVPHRAIARLVLNTNYIGIRPGDRIAHVSNPAFDAATFELWGALLNGACVVGIAKEVALSPGELAEALTVNGITALFVTTALFNRLAAQSPTVFSSLDTVMFGGETADPQWARSVIRNGPPRRLMNVYGPTETTTFATWYLIEDVPEGVQSIPIGRPMSNTRAYVLDGDMQLVSVGVPGELYIGGDGVARGYVNRPELTRERFVEDRFSGKPGARLYKTGDLVRMLPDGCLEFVGRLDGQVKLRGFRIELGEIEAVLCNHPAITHAAVILREDAPGEKRLAAYFVSRAGAEPRAGELRAFLREQLPDYMVPSVFMTLAELPLNANGKVDRRALPHPGTDRSQCEVDYVAPRNDVERVLAEIWAELLHVERVGVNDAFFEMGGHSLLAIQVASHVRDKLKMSLPLREFFEFRTVAKLAERIETLRSSRSSQQVDSICEREPRLVGLRTEGSRRPFFCVTGAGDVVGSYARLLELMSHDQPFHGFPDPQLGADYETFPSVEQLASEYIEEVRRVQPRGPYLLGGYSFGGMVAYEMAQQFLRAGEEVSALVLLDSNARDAKGNGNACAAERVAVVLGKVRARSLMIWHTLPNIVGYVRDGLRIAAASIAGKAADDAPRLSLKQYLMWIWHDIAGQYFLKQAGIAKPSIKVSRLAMINDPFVRKVSNTLTSCTQSLAEYRIEPYPGRIDLFRPEHDPWGDAKRDPVLGWDRFARGGVAVHVIPGNHIVLLRDPFVENLARELQACLDAADGGGSATR